jgi:3-mercaptopyruvate sulfurtransferase SseA
VLILKGLGFKKVQALLGGYNEWVKEGNPVVNGERAN